MGNVKRIYVKCEKCGAKIPTNIFMDENIAHTHEQITGIVCCENCEIHIKFDGRKAIYEDETPFVQVRLLCPYCGKKLFLSKMVEICPYCGKELPK